MNLADIQFIFNRALSWSFDKKKWLLIFSVLMACGLVTVFCQALSLHSFKWVSNSLFFLSFFISAGFCFALGIMLIGIYRNEVKNKSLKYREIFMSSWDLFIGTVYFTLPIVLGYLLLWMLLTIFTLLYYIPGAGFFLGALFSFIPFILNVGIILLFFFNIALLFVMVPVLSFNGLDKNKILDALKRRGADFFSNIVLGMISIFPLLIVFSLLFWGWKLTTAPCADCEESYFFIIQEFMMIIPFAAILAPTVAFFFNFAAEAHLFLQKRALKNSGV